MVNQLVRVTISYQATQFLLILFICFFHKSIIEKVVLVCEISHSRFRYNFILIHSISKLLHKLRLSQ